MKLSFLAEMGRQMLILVLGIVSGMFGTNIDIFAHLGGLVFNSTRLRV